MPLPRRLSDKAKVQILFCVPLFLMAWGGVSAVKESISAASETTKQKEIFASGLAIRIDDFHKDQTKDNASSVIGYYANERADVVEKFSDSLSEKEAKTINENFNKVGEILLQDCVSQECIDLGKQWDSIRSERKKINDYELKDYSVKTFLCSSRMGSQFMGSAVLHQYSCFTGNGTQVIVSTTNVLPLMTEVELLASMVTNQNGITFALVASLDTRMKMAEAKRLDGEAKAIEDRLSEAANRFRPNLEGVDRLFMEVKTIIQKS